MRNRTPIPIERARNLLDYDPVLGVFVWKPRDNPRWNGRYAGVNAGTLRADGYMEVKVDGTGFLAHRLAWAIMLGVQPPDEIDHRNTIKSDNRWDNIRPCTRSENCGNKPAHKNNRVGLKGVFPQGKRFGARIVPGGRHIHLGTFDTPEEAHAAYLEAAQEHFGEYHRG